MTKINGHLSIQQLSQKLEIPKSTFRYWEKEFDEIIIPFRTDGGQRRYSHEHVDIFKKIIHLQREGKSISEIKQILNENASKLELPHSQHIEHIENLADRLAEVVKQEIQQFFNKNI